MKLLIAIPAYNEESSIEGVIRRSLEARQNIIANSGVTAVDVTVVSDGSTDRTAELAERYSSMVNLIAFTQNRGYGAAIKEAWSHSDADLLGFLDADGTCDPNFFAELCRTLEAQGADIVVGCRMNSSSRMPWIRRVGNAFFAGLLRLLSTAPVRDAASGMRVVRRRVVDKLLPLPDGLHFTPAMTAQAMLGGQVRIAEVDMPYREREGKSKLKLVRDGWRFLRVIVEAALLFRPSRPLGILGAIALAAAVAMMVQPTWYYLHHRSIAEWMIYRFVVSHLAGSSAALLFAASYLTTRMARLTVAVEHRQVRVCDHMRSCLAKRLVLAGSRGPLSGRRLAGASQLPGADSHGCDLRTLVAIHRHDHLLFRGRHFSGYAGHGLCSGPHRAACKVAQARACLTFLTSASSKYLAEALPAARVVGVDTAASAIAWAQSRHGSSRVSFCTVTDCTVTGGGVKDAFDLCYSNGVFHHIPPAGRVPALRCIYDALTSAGLFAFFENNPWNPGTRMVMKRIPFDRDARTISPLHARRLLRAAGFMTAAPLRSLFYFPRALAFLRFSERWLAALPLGAQYCIIAAKG